MNFSEKNTRNRLLEHCNVQEAIREYTSNDILYAFSGESILACTSALLQGIVSSPEFLSISGAACLSATIAQSTV